LGFKAPEGKSNHAVAMDQKRENQIVVIGQFYWAQFDQSTGSSLDLSITFPKGGEAAGQSPIHEEKFPRHRPVNELF